MKKPSKIEPMKWRKQRPLRDIEHDGALSEVRCCMSKSILILRDMVERLTYEDYMHLEINVDQILEGLDELVVIHRRYRELQKCK
jgi:hypothetical protein